MVRPKTPAPDTNRRLAALQAKSGIERKPPPPPEPSEVPPKSRQGMKGVVIYLNPAAKRVLEEIAHTQDKTMQELGVEAINLLFAHYTRKPLA